MYKIINTLNDSVLYIVDDFDKAYEWSLFYEKQLGLSVRIETYNEYWVTFGNRDCNVISHIMWKFDNFI